MEPQEQKPVVTTPATDQKPATRHFLFPNHGVTIEATSQEEAEKKLADLNKDTK
jgi:hypothetical protein